MFEQSSLFGSVDPSFDGEYLALERIELDASAWLDYQPLWLSGDEELYQCLVDSADWTQPVVKMYEREVLTPRLVARINASLHPLIPQIIESASARYGALLDQVSAGWYRDGKDSVAYHGDRIARERRDAVVATVSLGEPRRFLFSPKAGGRATSFSLGHGDLVVMGGSCHRTWEHAVPKTAHAGPRIALMFRHRYD